MMKYSLALVAILAGSPTAAESGRRGSLRSLEGDTLALDESSMSLALSATDSAESTEGYAMSKRMSSKSSKERCAGLACRAYTINQLIEAASLDGHPFEPDHHEEHPLFTAMNEIRMSGKLFSELEDALALKGFSQQDVHVLSATIPGLKEDIVELHLGWTQKDLINTLSQMNEGDLDVDVKDIFGNDAVGPDAVYEEDEETALLSEIAEITTSESSCKLKTVVKASEPEPGHKGPGYKVRNDTPWPVEISLWQVGPLHWQLVQPGQWFYSKPGAVWFTLKATINMNNQPSINTWEAIWPIATATISVLFAIGTLGAGSELAADLDAAVAAGEITEVSTVTTLQISMTLIGMGLPVSDAVWIATAFTKGVGVAITSTGAVEIVKAVVLDDVLSKVAGGLLKYSKGGIYAGFPWPGEQTTQVLSVNGGLSIDNVAALDINPAPTPSPTGLKRGDALHGDDYVLSSNGQYVLKYQLDGNLVLSRIQPTYKVIWASGTGGKGVGEAAMQGDGNFVVYTAGGTAVWSSGTAGNHGAYLQLSDTGSLEIFNVNGEVIWDKLSGDEQCGILYNHKPGSTEAVSGSKNLQISCLTGACFI
eukprot:CAMPEP_0172526210 /NCGR_PEP_ID=MMETSP1067-20121228/1162_1 /TAXON_ID=265564 ORGANISM="Thalassiosira punctigera, Strain Tpunct2005C2" /NCGR_SAMPLE_ID=MMETSP1067 /ASSEMBLY_ACC=CAM_ASM_000444 /LENGTH=592 /DNA_ID=CAMNT_0013309661 /DNA_START=89 /DNA_END=1867 /DNA_ORIENTATION=-